MVIDLFPKLVISRGRPPEFRTVGTRAPPPPGSGANALVFPLFRARVSVPYSSIRLCDPLNAPTSRAFFSEILRVIDSLQLTAQKKVATPVNWKVR